MARCGGANKANPRSNSAQQSAVGMKATRVMAADTRAMAQQNTPRPAPAFVCPNVMAPHAVMTDAVEHAGAVMVLRATVAYVFPKMAHVATFLHKVSVLEPIYSAAVLMVPLRSAPAVNAARGIGIWVSSTA